MVRLRSASFPHSFRINHPLGVITAETTCAGSMSRTAGSLPRRICSVDQRVHPRVRRFETDRLSLSVWLQKIWQAAGFACKQLPARRCSRTRTMSKCARTACFRASCDASASWSGWPVRQLLEEPLFLGRPDPCCDCELQAPRTAVMERMRGLRGTELHRTT